MNDSNVLSTVSLAEYNPQRFNMAQEVGHDPTIFRLTGGGYIPLKLLLNNLKWPPKDGSTTNRRTQNVRRSLLSYFGIYGSPYRIRTGVF